MAAIVSRKSCNKVAGAALVMLVALLAAAGPAAGLTGIARPLVCFVGWSKLPAPFPLLLDYFFPCSPPSPKPDPPSGQGLSLGYYNKSDSCPNAEPLIRKAVEDATNQNRSIGAGLIRLFFHDSFVRGCDASVLLNTTASKNNDTERTGPPNANSLRGFEVIDAAKAAVETECPGKVSCADILAFAARDASSILSNGKIWYDVYAGRKDGRESFANETGQLPGPNSDVSQLKTAFAAQGLNLTDMVTLSGAHSIGLARCLFFHNQNRLSAMDPGYAKYLNDTCNAFGDSFKMNQDNKTADILDNQYYKNILDKFVLFGSDGALNSSQTIDQVKANADDYATTWYRDFGYAMVKMGNITDTTPDRVVEIRKVCWKVNDPY